MARSPLATDFGQRSRGRLGLMLDAFSGPRVDRPALDHGVERQPEHRDQTQEVGVTQQEQEEAERLAVGVATPGEVQVEREEQRQKLEEDAGKQRARPDVRHSLRPVGDYEVDRPEEDHAGHHAHERLQGEGTRTSAGRRGQ